jgi:serine protease Do
MIAETQKRTAALNGFAQRFSERSRFGLQSPLLEQPPSAPTPSALPLNPAQIYQRAALSVVIVLGFDQARGAVGQGSGVVIAPDTVATNCHVVQGADAVVILFRGNHYSVLGVEGNRKFDYCILRTAGLPAAPASIGRLDNVAPGQRVYTVGSPRGLELLLRTSKNII